MQLACTCSAAKINNTCKSEARVPQEYCGGTQEQNIGKLMVSLISSTFGAKHMFELI